MAGLRIDDAGDSASAWEGLLARADRCGLQQGWAYGAALAAGGIAVRRLVAREGGHGPPVACAQVAERRLLGLVPTAFLLRGPVWLDGAPAAPEREAELVAAVRARLGRPALVWAPESAAGPPGRRPVVSGGSTSWLDLARPLAHVRAGLRGTWRHDLRRAEGRGLEVADGGGSGLAWLLDRNEAQRRRVGYRGPGPTFLGRLAGAARERGGLLLLVARHAGEPVAGVLLVRHGRCATYAVGHVTGRGRALHAKHLLLWRAVERLGTAGARWLDLGGVDTERTPNLARFKLDLGGEIRRQAGTYLAPPFL